MSRPVGPHLILIIFLQESYSLSKLLKSFELGIIVFHTVIVFLSAISLVHSELCKIFHRLSWNVVRKATCELRHRPRGMERLFMIPFQARHS